ncbi:Crp/Fnr family transcriptional regulator [Desulforamulus ruminis]|uniref:Cyclic nucleotide-binding protein n=1 Tax=Desulforamulus ruminis (strain ATCC 23193 / DSM 2154 / NCIMB 8452 / DL) TaxID=696281 RepID=F6DSF0_DESRL|nr:Crp/Fnr family transcriptional regulator [Desulforamulus ruminis]AEG59929.1 cyclic nucleotide-binding protein [Desulforamulus ruminis DSM 2154]
MKDKAALLSTSPWVKAHFLKSEDLTKEDIDWIQKIGQKRCFPRDAIIIGMGSCGEQMYYLLKGTVRNSILNAGGVEKSVCYVTAGCFLGEEPFFHGQPTLYHTVVLEEVEALEISRKYMKEMISRPGLAHILLNSVSFKSRILATQIEDLAFRNTLEKVSRILYCILAENNGDREKSRPIHTSQQELAAIAGAHRVSITNAISQLKKEGIINRARDGSIIVRDWERLKEKGFSCHI